MRDRSPAPPRRITRQHPRWARMAALQAAQAQRIAELERHAERIALLGVAGAILSEAHDYAHGIARVASLLVPRMGDLCLIELTGHDLRAERIVARWHANQVSLEPWTPFARLAPAEHPFAPQLDRLGTTQLAQLSPQQAHALGLEPTATALVVPLHLGSYSFGLLVLARTNPSASYQPAELALVDDLALHLAQVLEHVRLTAASRYANQIKDEAFALLNAIFASNPIGLAALDPQLRYLRVNHALAAFDGLPLTAYLGRTPAEVLPEVALTIEPIIRQVLATGQSVRDVELKRGTAKTNPQRSWIANYSPVYGPNGTIIGVSAAITELTAQKQNEAQVRTALATAEQALTAANAASARIARLQTVTAALSGALTRREVVEVITRYALGTTSAQAMIVSVVNPSHDSLEIIGWVGFDFAKLEPFQGLPLQLSSPPTYAARTFQAVWLRSPDEAEIQFPGSRVIMADLGTQAIAALPLMTSNRMIGALTFSYADINPFGPDERALLTNVADQCAQALERAHLYAEVLAGRTRLQALSARLVATQEEERRHLARELHDEIGQSLTGLSLVLTIGHNLPLDQLYAQLAEAQRQVTSLIAQVRQRSLDLRPAMLDELGLMAALTWYLERYQTQTSIRVEATLALPPQPIPALVELTAYRIVQEALTNVARYAQVDEVSVGVWVAGNELLIEVSDHGVGFNPSLALRAHHSSGLAGMRERAALLGGDLTIDAAPGAGAHLLANLPLVGLAEPDESEEEQ